LEHLAKHTQRKFKLTRLRSVNVDTGIPRGTMLLNSGSCRRRIHLS
jgi:hypothetical protein